MNCSVLDLEVCIRVRGDERRCLHVVDFKMTYRCEVLA